MELGGDGEVDKLRALEQRKVEPQLHSQLWSWRIGRKVLGFGLQFVIQSVYHGIITTLHRVGSSPKCMWILSDGINAEKTPHPLPLFD